MASLKTVAAGLLRYLPLKGLRRAQRLQATASSVKVYKAVIEQKVASIERLPPKYRRDVQEIIWQSVLDGYDRDGLARQLTERFGLTPDRAAVVAEAQCRMARTVIDNARRIELGIKQAVWQHHGACKVASHRGLAGRRYALTRGIELNGQRLWPSGEPDCFCSSTDVEDTSQTSEVQ